MITHKQKMASLSSERRAKIEAGTEELHKEYLAIRRLREMLNLTQEEMAEGMGVKQPMISKIENGELRLTLENLSKIIKAFDPNAKWELTVTIPNKKQFILATSDESK